MNQEPKEGDSLVIQDGDSFLLDTSPPPLDSITIESGGKLVVADGMDIKLSVKYILIRGEMHVGSEDCKFTGKLHITVRGEELERGSDISSIMKITNCFLKVPNALKTRHHMHGMSVLCMQLMKDYLSTARLFSVGATKLLFLISNLNLLFCRIDI